MTIKADVDTRNEAWAKDKSSFGQRMLAKMGWEEGKGLGKNKQGTVNNLRAVRRAENLGIGASTDLHGEEGFNVTRQNYHGVLEKLKQEHGGAAVDKQNNKSKKTSSKKKSSTTTLAQNRVSAGHARKMRESKDLTKKSKEDMAAIFGMKVDAYTASSSVWGKLQQSAVSQQQQDVDTTIEEQDNTTHVVSADPSPVCSDTESASKKLKKQEKKKDKNSNDVDKKEKKKKRKKSDSESSEESKRSKKSRKS
jgi:Pin2-interacting protein X1